MEFDIKNGTLEATDFNLLKAEEEYLFARGWKKIFNNMYTTENIYDYSCVEIKFSEDGYNLDYAVKMQKRIEYKLIYG